jgi:streptogramin lyase
LGSGPGQQVPSLLENEQEQQEAIVEEQRESSKKSSREAGQRHTGDTGSRWIALFFLLLLALTLVAGGSAIAEPSEGSDSGLPTPEDIRREIESGNGNVVPAPATDLAAAESLPHADLDRQEASELLASVFPDHLQAPAGAFDELEVEKFLAPNVAVINASDADQRNVDPGQLSGSVLLEASIPLRTEPSPSGSAAIDLTLENKDGEVQSDNPLVAVNIPEVLGEGIELPRSGVTIALENAPEDRALSIIDDSVGFMPNVAADTDLAIAPTPTGVETLTQLRSPSAPKSQTFHLELPTGAAMARTQAGGAVVTSGEETLLEVAPPTAVDAAGQQVPAELTVSGHSLILAASPDQDTVYPILVDPLYQDYSWPGAKSSMSGICNSSYKEETSSSCNDHEEWSYEVLNPGGVSPPPIQVYRENLSIWVPVPQGTPGIFIRSSGTATVGSKGSINYTVPRFFADQSYYGVRPTSFISKMRLWNVDWNALSSHLSPYLVMGLWDVAHGSPVSYYSHEGLTGHSLSDMSWEYIFPNPTENTGAKVAYVNIQATETQPNQNADLYVGAASLQLGDKDVPQELIAPAQLKWVNESAPPLQFTAVDSGLGVFAISASTEELGTNGQPLYTWKAANGCIGVGDSACPRAWSSSQAKQPLTYDPKVLPTGINYLNLVAEDPVGNRSIGSLEEVRVDHVAPTLALTGSLTEQEQLGTRRATYALKATGSDGSAEHPQSGIAKGEIKLDGKAVTMEGKQAEEWSPNCPIKNCSLSAEWTLNTAGLADGKHTVEVIATDAVGISTTKTLSIETHAATPPTLALSGSMTEQATLGTSRPRYVLKAKSTATAAGFEAPTLGATAGYSSSIGSSGTGNGQFYAPADVATDTKGNLWALDKANNRLQKFNEKSEWVLTAGVGKLSSPSALALDASGNVWVTDTGSNRVVEFKENGEFLRTFGTNVNKTKVEAGGTLAEKNLCTAASGNVCQAATAGSLAGQLKSPQGIAVTPTSTIWVVDSGNGRLEKFDMSGNYVSSLSSEGTEAGKLKEPKAITIAPDGSLWVADYGNNRIQRWSGSTFVAAIGKEGSGAGEFKGPAAIEADSTGNIWVGDQKNNRVEQFDRTGVYLNQFGSGGSGSGQFSLGAAMGLTVDRLGSIWVTDPGHFQVQRWLIPGFPVYSSSIGGTSGTGNGQFSNVADVATDTKGNVWALDKEANRLQKFNEKGEWVLTTGAVGSGAGKLSSPSAVALDASGDAWVADTANNRVVEFKENGEFLRTFGTNVNKTKVEAAGTAAEKNLCTAASGNVCQAATAGSVAGQLSSPQGIVVTPTNTIWVVDSGNGRLEKFDMSGNYISSLSSEGTEAGKLKEPKAITIAPDGSLWVADYGNNRIQQWNNSSFVRAVGKEGAAGGDFKGPAAIEADATGNIWVGDQKNNRVEEFAEGGKYLGQFGAEGSGIFSFSSPMGIAIDSGGSIWVTEAGHFKVQKWVQEVPRSEITTILWLDNNQQTGLHGTCKGAICTIEPQWTVESKALSTGSHSAKVKTTDGLGRSTESTVSFQITPDTTQPTLEAGGELVNAPEGWVEQETYDFNATASDGGSGVTSIVFKIDGQQVASASQTCPDGGCKETLSKQISMASYAGGSHPAEIMVTDGAGNAIKKAWTINVDPEGHISTEEVEATLEAVEGTTEGTPITPNEELLEPEQIENGNSPELQQVGSKITSTGAPDLTTMTTNPAAGFTISSPYGETTIIPKVSEATSNTSVVEGVAGVSANASSQVDSVIRPEYNGVQIFQAIRSEASPEEYSWTIQLSEGQVLRLADSTHAEVVYESGKRAFLITAEEAHDATGKEVPTSLGVSGSVLTLSVEFHKAAFVYPILSGQGWATAYNVPVVVEGPEDEIQIREREEREREEQGEEAIPPTEQELAEFPEPHTQAQFDKFAQFGAEEASGTIGPPFPGVGGKVRSVLYRSQCGPNCSKFNAKIYNASIWSDTDGGWSKWESGTEVHAKIDQSNFWTPIFLTTMWNCGIMGPTLVRRGEGEHLTAYGHFTVEGWFTKPKPGVKPGYEKNFTLFGWVYPNGFQERHVNWNWSGSTLTRDCPVGGGAP